MPRSITASVSGPCRPGGAHVLHAFGKEAHAGKEQLLRREHFPGAAGGERDVAEALDFRLDRVEIADPHIDYRDHCETNFS
jgi:hypothetical protein